MTSKNTEDNISFLIDENENENETQEINESDENIDISSILDHIETNTFDININSNNLTHFIVNYQLNYTVKQLLQICDYYGIAKELKTNKYSKDEIICVLVHFENNDENSEIVFKRQTMWLYINELKNDKFMKKYIFF